MRSLVHFLVGLVVGLVAIAQIGVPVSDYLLSSGVMFAVCLPIGIPLLVLANWRGAGDNARNGIASGLVFAVSLIVRDHFGFTIHQMIVLAVLGAISTFVMQMLLPSSH